MIPYDDLVIALTTWRARQGLPVAQLSGALTPPPPAPAPAPTPAPAPAKPAARTAPPGAPPGGLQTRPTAPAKAQAALVEDSLDVDDGALLEEAHLDGSDFAMSFDNPGGEPGESTAIGVPPPPRSSADADADGDEATPPPPRRGGRNW